MDTIAAISTPNGKGGIGIVRISGDNAIDVASRVFRAPVELKDVESRKMILGTVNLIDARDKALCVVFRAPNSYTGEDVVERHCHGGVSLIDAVLKAVLNAGAKLAGAGEFTKRAFLNGKLKLADAEGIIDIINAQSVSAVNAAYRLMSGKLSDDINVIQNKLLDLIAHLEAIMDYPEELEDEGIPDGRRITEELFDELKKLYDTKNVGRMIKNGVAVAIIGLPNAGKSSLLNRLLKCDRAIVTDIEGTTRDVVEDTLVYNGEMIRLLDTAGIRETDNHIEKIGIDRSKKAIKGADVVIIVLDGEREDARENALFELVKGKPYIVCVNKSDLGISRPINEDYVIISAKTGDGTDELLKRLTDITVRVDGDSEIITNERHAQAVKRAKDALERALDNYDDFYIDCIVNDLKEAYDALGEITGNTVSEDVINAIFDKFCVGK